VWSVISSGDGTLLKVAAVCEKAAGAQSKNKVQNMVFIARFLVWGKVPVDENRDGMPFNDSNQASGHGMGNPATKVIPQMFKLGGLFERLGANFCTLSGSRNFGIKMTQIVSPA
jgi:hypothetical protein